MILLAYSPVNQCWFLLWNDSVIGLYENKHQALTDLSYKGLQVTNSGEVVSAVSTSHS